MRTRQETNEAEGPAPRANEVPTAPGKVTRAQQLAGETAGGGRPLPQDLTSRYSSMGADVDNVRLHTGARSAGAAADIGARAFTVGNDIHFSAGAYDPHSSMGKALLAHEVGHTQQSHGSVRCKTTSGEAAPGMQDDESQADSFADAAIDAEKAEARERERKKKLKKDIVVQAKKIAATVKESVNLLSQIPSGDASNIIERMKVWRDEDMLPDFIAELRSIKISNDLPEILGGAQSQSCWRFLISSMKESDQTRLYAVLAKNNINAKNWGRLTDDLREYWDERMAADVTSVKFAWERAENGEGDEHAHHRRIVTIIEKYVGLDEQFGMNGTLLSRFLNRMNLNTTKNKLILPDEASILLEDLKAEFEGENSSRLMAALDKSHLEMAKQPLPEDDAIAQWVADKLAGFADRVDGLLSILANAPENFRNRVWKHLCAVDGDLIVDFLIACAETFGSLTRKAFELLSPKTIVRFLTEIDVARLAAFMGSWLALNYVAIMAPIYLPVFLLLSKDRQMKVLALLDEVIFKTLIKEARSFAVPFLRGLLDERWPVNIGVGLDRAVGVATGAAFAHGEKYWHLIRSSTDTIKYRERLELRGGVGRGGGIGKNLGDKPNKQGDKGAQTSGSGAEGEGEPGVLAEAAGQAQAGVEMVKVQVSEFPIFDDDAFFALLLTVLELDEVTSAGAMLSDSLAEVDPLAWMKETKIEMNAFGDAASSASIGKVTNGADAKPGEKQTWNETEGRPDLGDSSKWEKMFGRLSATAQAFGSIGGVVELKEASDDKDKHAGIYNVSFSARANAITAANIKVPLLGNLPAALPKADHEGGVRLVYKMSGIQTQNPTLLNDGPRLELFGGVGDLDMHRQAGSEVSLELGTPDSAAFKDLSAFRSAIEGFTVKKRFGIQIPIGSSLWDHVKKQKSLSTALKDKETEKVGGALEAYLDFEARLEKDHAREVFDLLVTPLQEISKKGLVKRLRKDLQALLHEGKVPDYLKNLERIVSIFKQNIEKALLHVEGGLRAGGRKEEFEFQAGATLIYEKNIINQLRGQLGDLPDADVLKLLGDVGPETAKRLSELVGAIKPD